MDRFINKYVQKKEKLQKAKMNASLVTYVRSDLFMDRHGKNVAFKADVMLDHHQLTDLYKFLHLGYFIQVDVAGAFGNQTRI